ncbi:hypothetical protein [uncultured Methanobrevibacter sp.]|nr:hypothetical protein [uncultured Methanobrevibacter sp.]
MSSIDNYRAEAYKILNHLKKDLDEHNYHLMDARALLLVFFILDKLEDTE